MYNFITPEEYLSGAETTYCGEPYRHTAYDDYEKVYGKPITISREEYVRRWIGHHYELAMLLADHNPHRKRKGFFANLFDTTSRLGAYSRDPTIARQSIVLVAQNEIAAQRAWMTTRDRIAQIRREHREVLAMTEEYFHGAERRQQAADVEMARMAIQADMIAEALARKLK